MNYTFFMAYVFLRLRYYMRQLDHFESCWELVEEELWKDYGFDINPDKAICSYLFYLEYSG